MLAMVDDENIVCREVFIWSHEFVLITGFKRESLSCFVTYEKTGDVRYYNLKCL